MLATPTVVILDDAHRMPQATMRELLAYLLNNAPPNLQFLIGTRRPLELQLTDLLAAGRMATLDAARPAARASTNRSRSCGRGSAARIASTMPCACTTSPKAGRSACSSRPRRSSAPTDLHEMIGQLNARRGDIQRFFFESLLSRLPPSARPRSGSASRSSRCSMPRLCEAVTGRPRAASYIERLAARIAGRDDRARTATGCACTRWHAISCSGSSTSCPAEERRALLRTRRGLVRRARPAAGRGAPRAGRRQRRARGRVCGALPARHRARRPAGRGPRLDPPPAAACAAARRAPAAHGGLDDRAGRRLPPTCPALIEQASGVTRSSTSDCRFRPPSSLAAAGDLLRPAGLIGEALQDWDEPPAGALPLHLSSLANTRASLALPAGRYRSAPGSCWPRPESRIARAGHAPAARVRRHDGRTEPPVRGQPQQGDRRAAAAAGTGRAGDWGAARRCRRCSPACWRRRIDCAGRTGAGTGGAGRPARRHRAPRACRTRSCSRIASLAEASRCVVARKRARWRSWPRLRELGVARDLPRMMLISLAEQVRIHAMHGRIADGCGAAGTDRGHGGRSSSDRLPRHAALLSPAHRGARRRLCVPRRTDLDGAEAALRIATDAPPSARRGAMTLVARALHALVAHERGRPDARDMLAEVLSLAELAGIRSYVEAAHPGSQKCCATAAGGAAGDARGARALSPREHASAAAGSGRCSRRQARRPAAC